MSSAAFASDRSPCPGVVFVGAGAPRLTDVERRLVCGDPARPAWAEIPLEQARYFLTAFLQQRGYQEPRFDEADGVLRVDAGAKSRIRGLSVAGLPPGVTARKLRRIKGRDLTPKDLDQVQKALVDLLQARGYPCPEVELSADASSGQVDAAVRPGPPRAIGGAVPPEAAGVDPRVLGRYEAFRPRQPFDMRLLALTSQRILGDALFVSAYYDVACSTEGRAAIYQRVVGGKPQLYRLGVGFDTEGFLIGKAQWQNSRVGRGKNTLEGSVYASFRRETAEASVHYYASPASRLYLMPRAAFDREDQLQYQYVKWETSAQPGASWDGERLRAEALAGPALDHVTTVRGIGPANDTFVAFKTRWSLIDHLYEYHSSEPREGWRAALDTVSRAAGTETTLTAHYLSLTGETLWNAGAYDPPALVLGTRYWLATTHVNDQAVARRDLPPDMRLFLGGNANLRGAAVSGLPSDDAGFLTVLYDGLELRLADVLAYGLQPLIFVDGAMGGRTDLHLDPDVYWSPGAGLRWRLPVGSIRGTVARGMVWRRDERHAPLFEPRWQLFFSFGEEF